MTNETSRTAVVTGASSGLGAATAVALAEHADVVLVARRQDRLAEIANRIRDEFGRSPLVVAADVSKPEDVETLRSQTHLKFGRATILVNSAGIFGPFCELAESEPAEWIETIQVNVIGAYLTCRAFVGDMIEAGWGRIVNVSSAASLAPPVPLNSAYATSKVALNQLTRNLAAELDGTGVTANVIHPGSLATEMYVDIRSKVAGVARGEAHQEWVDLVASTGGDAISSATDLILDLVSDAKGDVNGAFCWPAGSRESQLETW